MRADTPGPVVAYVPFRTFLSALVLFDRGIPERIDPSVWPTYSVATRSQLYGAFRFLGLIDGGGGPTAVLKALVHDKPNRKVTMRKILETSYARVVDLGLTSVSPRQFDQAMREYGMGGETHKKVISFFRRAARFAELPMSPLLGKKARVVGASRKRRRGLSEIVAEKSVGSPPHGSSLQLSKTVILRGGGSITVNIEGNVFELEARDRRFVFGLIDRLVGYQKRMKSPPA